MQEKPKTTDDRLEAIEKGLSSLADIIESVVKDVDGLKKTTLKKATGLFGGKRTKTAIKDTKTSNVYPSKAAVGKRLAGTEDFKDLDPGDNFAWYKIIAAAPDRFTEASEEESEKVWKEEDEVRKKEVEEANKRLEEERKAAAGKK